MKSVHDLAAGAQEALRATFQDAPGSGWVVRLAGQAGWTVANRRYLASMRERGAREMATLIQALRPTTPISSEEAFDLVEAAARLLSPTAEVRRFVDHQGERALHG